MRIGKLALLLILITFLVVGIAGCGFLGQPELKIVNWSTKGDKGILDTFTINGEGVNVGSATGVCRVNGRIYDSSDKLMESSADFISGLKPGESWNFEIVFLINPDKIDHAEVEADECFRD